jgi:hypothetical protein
MGGAKSDTATGAPHNNRSTMNKISGVKKGDIVRIKFKDMRDIVNTKETNKRNHKTYTIVSEWELGANILAFTYGGDFLVKEDAPSANKDQSLELVNHLDGGEFDVPERIIDSLEIVDAAHRFVSEEHKVAMIMTETDIFINGVKVENCDDGKFLDDFVKFAERYLTTKAINNSLKE